MANVRLPPAGIGILIRFVTLPGAVLSCAAKKVPKERGIGEGLS